MRRAAPAGGPRAGRGGPAPGHGRDVLHAEWTKLRTLPSTLWLLAAVVVLTAGLGAAAAAEAACPAAGCGQDPAKVSLTGIDLGQAVLAMAAVPVMGEEYGTGMIRVTLAAVPRRLSVLAAKAAVVAGAALAAGTLAVLACVPAARLLLPGRGFTAAHGFAALSLADGPTLRAAAGSVLYLALIALFALGVAAAVRDTATATGLVLAVLYVFPIVAAVVPDPAVRRHLMQVGPLDAGLDVASTTNLASLPLTPWQGLGVAAAWAAGALLLGGAVLRLRDA